MGSSQRRMGGNGGRGARGRDHKGNERHDEEMIEIGGDNMMLIKVQKDKDAIIKYSYN